jgi:hypothetical protein
MQSAVRNSTTVDCTTQVVVGQYTPPNGSSFNALSNTDPVSVPNAVQIQMPGSVQTLFAVPQRVINTSRTAVAGNTGAAGTTSTAAMGFTMGSFLVGWNSSNFVGGVVLDALLHTTLTGQLLGYRGLASTYMTLGDLASASAGAFTVDNLFTGAVTLQQIMNAEATVLTNNGNPNGAANLRSIQGAMGAYGTSSIATPIMSLGTSNGYGTAAAAEGAVSVSGLDLLDVAAQAANGSSALNLGAAIPPLSLSAQVTMIQPPVVVPAEPPNIKPESTAQVSALLTLPTGSVTFTGAQATGELTWLDCSTLDSIISVTTTGLSATLPGQPAQSFASANGNAGFTAPYSPPQTKTVATNSPDLSALGPVGALGNPILYPLLSDLGLAVAGVDVTPNALGPSCPSVGSPSPVPPTLIQ